MRRSSPEDLYPLAPVQRGLLAQELLAPGQGHYLVQFVSTLHGQLDVTAFRTAWQSVQSRHAVLRSSFVWEKVEQPLQVVHRSAPLPFSVEPEAGPAWLDNFLEDQRRHSLRLQRTPLFSVTLGRVADDLHHLVWCYHHLLLDGWSSAVVLREVFSEYSAAAAGRRSALAAPVPYSRYLEWLASQQAAACEKFWRAELEGCRQPASTAVQENPCPLTERLMLSRDLQKRLDAFLRSRRITTATFVHALWALLLGRRTGSNEVIFGSVVSGRPAALGGADRIVGPLINVLPFRVRLSGIVAFSAWLQELQARLVDVQRFGAVSLAQIQSWAGASPGTPLFDSILTLENYPDGIWQQMDSADVPLRISGVHFVESTGYPLCLQAIPADRLVLQILYDRNRFEPELIAGLLTEAESLLQAAVAEPSPEVAQLLRRPVEDPQPLAPSGHSIARQTTLTAAVAQPDRLPDRDTPRNTSERTLVKIWEKLLGIPIPGMESSFFELGGDSILCILMVFHARNAGLHLTPKQVFEHRTISRLAEIAAPVHTSRSVPVRTEGPVPLTPIQQWFFNLEVANRNHWNQAVLVELGEAVESSALKAALDAVALNHDAFRLRFQPGENGWQQRDAPSIEPVPLGLYSAAEQEKALRETHEGLDIGTGPLFRAALIDGEPGRPARLLLVAHHLVIDVVSWRIVFEDLASCLGQAAQGSEIRLPEGTCTYRQWAEWAAEHRMEPAEDSVSEKSRRVPIPRDMVDGRPASESSSAFVTAFLSNDETAGLLDGLARSSRMSADELVLAAAAFAIGKWADVSHVHVDRETHGRLSSPDIDTSRTVGWFTSFQPVALQVGEFTDSAALLRTIREDLARAGTRPDTEQRRSAEVSFNFIGDIDSAMNRMGTYRLLTETAGPLHDPDAVRPYLLGIEAAIIAGRLRLTWSYSEHVHRRATLEALASNCLKALRAMIFHARYGGDFLPSPVDFPYADLTLPELDTLFANHPKPEDIYKLTPVQQGILFHALYAPESTVYFIQFWWTFRGRLDANAYEEAWRAVVARHPALRTSFVHKGLRDPHQLVHTDVDLPFHEEDWRKRTDDLDEAWQMLLDEERSRPFDPTRPPLMRLLLIRTGEDAYRFLWNHHHLLFDGWCTGIILSEVFRTYEALCRGVPAESTLQPPPRPFRDYVAWLTGKDLEKARTFWREQLRGIESAAPLPFPAPELPERGAPQVHRSFSLAMDKRLRELARANDLTVNTIVMGAWAILLSDVLHSRDVVFGSTCAGRPPEMEGSERMVGLFISTLPVRARVVPDMSMKDWLAELQRSVAAAREFEHVSPAQIRRWSGVIMDQPLFETAVVFENLPEFSVVRRSLPDLEISDIGSFVRNDFAFTVRAVPGPPLSMDALFDPQCVSRDTAVELLEGLEAVLTRMTETPSCSVAELMPARARSMKV